MKNNRCGLLFFLLLAWNSSVAEVISPAADSVSLTVYRNDQLDSYYELSEAEAIDSGLVMVTETRSVELNVGSNQLIFMGVADGIIPQTATLEGVNGEIVESNFNYDLMSPDELVIKSIDKKIKVRRTNPVTGKLVEESAIIRAYEKGIVLEMDGRFESLGCGGSIEAMVFPLMPENLAAEPRLSSVVKVETSGFYKLTLSYLAVGIQWKADYVATVNPKNRNMDLSAWVTLTNSRSTNFSNVPVQVIAGRVERDESETVAPLVQPLSINTQCWPISLVSEEDRLRSDSSIEEVVVTGIRASIAKFEEFADYKLYSFPSQTTVAPYQSKQVMLLSKKKIPFKSKYQYSFYAEDLLEGSVRHGNKHNAGKLEHPNLVIYAKNIDENNLGLSLPEGDVIVNELLNDTSIMIGESYTRDVPVGLFLNLNLEEAMDIFVRASILNYQEDNDVISVEVEFEITNKKSEKIDFELQQRMPEMYALLNVQEESLKHRIEYGMLRWNLKIDQNKTKKVRLKLMYRDLY